MCLWSPPLSSPLPLHVLPPAFGVFLLRRKPTMADLASRSGASVGAGAGSGAGVGGGVGPASGVVVCLRGVACGCGGENSDWLNDLLGEKEDVATVAEAAQRWGHANAQAHGRLTDNTRPEHTLFISLTNIFYWRALLL